jgi:hypothetical protein
MDRASRGPNLESLIDMVKALDVYSVILNEKPELGA